MKLEDVKVGMKVRVIGTQKSHTDGWNNSWVSGMSEEVGGIFKVLSIDPLFGITLDTKVDFYFPWQVLEPVEQSTGHPHADLMAQYAEDAKVKDRPWELWQYYDNDTSIWGDLGHNPAWCTNTQYRRKPKTIKIGEFDVPAPETERPVEGTVYYYPSLTTEAGYGSTRWYNASIDKELLERGLVHLTKEAAIAHTKALLSFTIT
jgi:hypothetical protein